MGRAKIAPALEAVLAWPPPYAKTGINAALVSIQAAAEFRALRGVVRAAERYAWSLEDRDPLKRALARLSRASREGRVEAPGDVPSRLRRDRPGEGPRNDEGRRP